MKMWTVWIKDQTAHSDLHCPQKLLESSTVRKELTLAPHFTTSVAFYSKHRSRSDYMKKAAWYLHNLHCLLC